MKKSRDKIVVKTVKTAMGPTTVVWREKKKKSIRDPKKVDGKKGDPFVTRARPAHRTQEEVDRVLNWAYGALDKGSRFPGETFEAGVEQGIRWVIGDIDLAPDQDG